MSKEGFVRHLVFIKFKVCHMHFISLSPVLITLDTPDFNKISTFIGLVFNMLPKKSLISTKCPKWSKIMSSHGV